MAKPYESECHSSGRKKMDSITGSPKNFESRADKAHRIAKFQGGGAVDDGPQPVQIPPSLPNPFEKLGPGPRKPRMRPGPTPVPPVKL